MSKKRGKTKSKHEEKLKDLKRLIIRVFQNANYKQLNYKQVAAALDYRNPRQRELVVQCLHQMCSEKILKNMEHGKFLLEVTKTEVTGKLDFNHSGNAYLVTEHLEKDIFISSKNTLNAFHNDIVKVIYDNISGKKRLEGRVSEVIKRHKNQYVGKFQQKTENSFGFVVIENEKFHVDFFIPKDYINQAKDGEIVLVELISWEEGNNSPLGKVIEVLGLPGDNEAEIHAILAEYGLPYQFPKEIEEEANQIDIRIHQEEILKRRDMRNITTFTIDPKDAKDFDDALSFQQLENGLVEVGIHIADVSHYVQPNSKLDIEAYERATSVYLVDRVVPMLPEILSNNVCSLRPNEDKLTFSAIFTLDENAKIHTQWFGRTVIHSDRRFTYEEAQEIIEGNDGDLKNEILILNDLAIKMRNQRMKKGAIAFDKVEVKFQLNEKDEPTNVYFKISKEANHLIEEFMLLANKEVSKFVSLKNNKPSGKTYIYRIHDDPNPEKLANLKQFVKTFGYNLELENREKIADSLNTLLTDVKGKGEEGMIETLAMRAMSKAKYSSDNIGHYGLAFDYYSHFTSPIRRYPDVIAHRLLQHYLDDGKSVDAESVEIQAQHCSTRERIASDAERDSIKYMQVKFMKKHEGEIFNGIISGVTEWGIYIEIIENQCEGLIRLKNITDDDYRYEPKNYSIVGQRTGNTYQLGNPVKIKVVRANLEKKQLDFGLVD
jgi:ribonuclease R